MMTMINELMMRDHLEADNVLIVSLFSFHFASTRKRTSSDANKTSDLARAQKNDSFGGNVWNEKFPKQM